MSITQAAHLVFLHLPNGMFYNKVKKAAVIKHFSFLTILDRKIIKQMFTYMDSTMCFVKHIHISQNTFTVTPNSMKILYSISLLEVLNS
jgi:hypothetical protein